MPLYDVHFMETTKIFKNIEARDEKQAVTIARRDHLPDIFKTTTLGLPWHIEAIKHEEPADFYPPLNSDKEKP